MNYLGVTLALLLAVGSQAAHFPSISAEDVPVYMQQLREAMEHHLAHGKQHISTALDGVVNPGISAQVRALSQMVAESIQDKIQGTQETVQTISNAFLTTVTEATADIRESIVAKIDKLKLQLDPHSEKLQEVVSSHLEQYQTIMGPIAENYQRKSEAEMAALKAKLEPIGENLRELVPRNVEETKDALMPILESLKSKGVMWLQTAKNHVAPYIQPHKTKIKNFVRNTRERAGRITDEEWMSLREKVTAHGQIITEKLMEIKRDIFG